MGDLNANTPSIRGLEFRPKSFQWKTLDSPAKGVLQRIRPGAVTLDRVNLYVPQFVGFPGTAIEILDTIAPLSTLEYRFPGTDTGATTTGWQDQSAGAATFDKINDTDTADYHQNSVIGPMVYNAPKLKFRGASAISAGKRIGSIRLYALVAGVNTSNVAVTARGVLDIGGVEYYGATVPVSTNGLYGTALLGTWAYNPATGKPWTLTECNALCNGTDEFGILWSGSPGAVGYVRVAGMYLQISTCTENRRAFLYGSSAWVLGWKDYGTLGGLVAESASTWYWLHVWPLTADTSNYVSFPFLRDPNLVLATTAAATTGEHRAAGTTSVGEGGVVYAVNAVAGDIMPALFEVAGAIQSQSFPYAQLTNQDVYTGSPANFGQEITLPTGTTYGGVKLTVGWGSSLRPDEALKIEVRSAAGSLTGGGTLHATGFLYPQDTLNATFNDYQIDLDTPFSVGAAVVVVLYITSAATATRPWRLALLDDRSDVLTTTTAAEVDGASFGWQTGGTQDGTANSYFVAGALNDRYDVSAALLSAPTAPAGFTATPVAAA